MHRETRAFLERLLWVGLAWSAIGLGAVTWYAAGQDFFLTERADNDWLRLIAGATAGVMFLMLLFTVLVCLRVLWRTRPDLRHDDSSENFPDD